MKKLDLMIFLLAVVLCFGSFSRVGSEYLSGPLDRSSIGIETTYENGMVVVREVEVSSRTLAECTPPEGAIPFLTEWESSQARLIAIGEVCRGGREYVMLPLGSQRLTRLFPFPQQKNFGTKFFYSNGVWDKKIVQDDVDERKDLVGFLSVVMIILTGYVLSLGFLHAESNKKVRSLLWVYASLIFGSAMVVLVIQPYEGVDVYLGNIALTIFFSIILGCAMENFVSLSFFGISFTCGACCMALNLITVQIIKLRSEQSAAHLLQYFTFLIVLCAVSYAISRVVKWGLLKLQVT